MTLLVIHRAPTLLLRLETAILNNFDLVCHSLVLLHLWHRALRILTLLANHDTILPNELHMPLLPFLDLIIELLLYLGQVLKYLLHL